MAARSCCEVAERPKDWASGKAAEGDEKRRAERNDKKKMEQQSIAIQGYHGLASMELARQLDSPATRQPVQKQRHSQWKSFK